MGEPLEMWGVPTRDAFYDHGSHYWNATEALVDELLKAETASIDGGRQSITVAEDGLAAGIPGLRPALVPRAEGVDSVEITSDSPWRIRETRTVTVGGAPFWLLALERAPHA